MCRIDTIVWAFTAFIMALPVLAQDRVTVFAAASTQPVMDALIPALDHHHILLTPVYAGSAALARQIELGAGADVYITANGQWMDYLVAKDLVEPGTRSSVATNRLVLISRPPLPVSKQLFGPGYPLAELLGDGRLAIGDPGYVPAGRYGREALISIGAWNTVKDKLAPTKDVTGALMLVARGEAPFGIVYSSDARRTTQVQIFQTFPIKSHSPIVYQAALMKGHGRKASRVFLDILAGPEGQAAFRAAGFGLKP